MVICTTCHLSHGVKNPDGSITLFAGGGLPEGDLCITCHSEKARMRGSPHDFRTRKGEVLTSSFSTYLIPGVYDIPQRVDSIIVEEAHPQGPYGVRGMAEMPYLPYAAVIAAAVFDAIGIWFYEFPLTPERVLRGLGKVRSRVK